MPARSAYSTTSFRSRALATSRPIHRLSYRRRISADTEARLSLSGCRYVAGHAVRLGWRVRVAAMLDAVPQYAHSEYVTSNP